jgi:hypothetical protein
MLLTAPATFSMAAVDSTAGIYHLAVVVFSLPFCYFSVILVSPPCLGWLGCFSSRWRFLNRNLHFIILKFPHCSVVCVVEELLNSLDHQVAPNVRFLRLVLKCVIILERVE